MSTFRLCLTLFLFVAAVSCNAIFDIAPPELVDGLGGEGGGGGEGNDPKMPVGGSPGATSACTHNSDCPNKDHICLFKECGPPCKEDRDCADSYRCLFAEAEVGTCHLDCSDDRDRCAADQACKDGFCQKRQDPEGPIVPGNPCSERGLVACVEVERGASVARVRCDGDLWQPHEPCGDAELCDPDHEQPGVCMPIPELCLGRQPGESFCQDAIRVTCSSTLLRTSRVTCPSAQHCTLGQAKECAVCLPNTYQCDGKVLKACNAASTGYVKEKTCNDPELPCSETAGECSPHPCTKNQKRCSTEGDVLEICAEDRSQFIELKKCKAGLCDHANKECDECVADTARCEDGKRITCSKDGHKENSTDCDESTPYCVGAGSCVACTEKEQCSAEECSAAVCDNNTCSSVPADSGEECTGGYCAADGSCVQCLGPTQCPTDNDCYTPTCNTNVCGQTPRDSGLTCSAGGGHFCNGSGSCVECVVPNNCSVDNDCYTPTCDGNSCGQTAKRAGLVCTSGDGGFCNGLGACVECVLPENCAVTGDCYNPTCNGNTCGQLAKDAGLTCDSSGGRVCNGSGSCVACTQPDHCPAVAECLNRTCSNNTCGQLAKARAISCSNGNVCDGIGNCVPNVPYAVGESSNVGWSSFEVTDNNWWIVPVTVPRTATLQAFRLIGASASGQARMAIWADDGGGPGAYIAQTANFGMAQGVVSQPPTSGTQLIGGRTYWVGAKFTGGASIFLNEGSGDFFNLEQAFSAVPSATLNPFPLGSASYDMGILLNFYLLLLDVPQ